MDLRSSELFKHGIRIRLQDQPFQVLTLLLDRPGEVIAREELQRRLWTSDTFVDFESGLNAAIRRLRDALNESADEPRYIETLPRHGYRFIANLEKIYSPAEVDACEALSLNGTRDTPNNSDQPLPSVPSAVVAARRIPTATWRMILAPACCLILLAAFGAVNWRHRIFGPHASNRVQSIAVLPLENLSGDPSQDYFADGMTDALITDLAQINSLRVISRTSSIHYKGTKASLSQIAKELNVDAVVEGVVVRSGDRVRIDAQLIRADGEGHIWAKSYDREVRNILALQSELAKRIAAEIAAKVTPEELARLERVRTVDPQAYENYVQGLFYWNKRTSSALLKSVDYFDKAIQIDPNYAAAHAGLALSYDVLGYSAAAALSEQAAAPKAKAAAFKALELDPELSEAHTALARELSTFEMNFDGAEEEYKKAIDLDPNNALAYQWFGMELFFDRGRREEGLEMMLHAQHLDPVSPNVAKVVGEALTDLGRYKEARVQLERAVELDPAHFNTRLSLANLYFRMNMSPEAISEVEKAVEVSGGAAFAETCLAQSYFKLGRVQDAEKILRQMKLQERNGAGSNSYLIAVVSASLGHRDDAMHWLEKAYEVRSSGYREFPQESAFELLRSDPRFVALDRRLSSQRPPVNGLQGLPDGSH